MVVKVVVGVTVFLVATIAVARGIRAADWALLRQMPGQEWHLADGALGHASLVPKAAHCGREGRAWV